MKLLSLVIPCYCEEQSIPIFYREICAVADQMREQIELELLFIDDGSQDGTLNVLKQLHKRDARVGYLSFSRNFGKEAAIYAGLKKATGDLVGTMDVDLQDPPILLKEMYDGIVDEGYDCVATRRVSRKGESPLRSWFAKWFYRVFNRLSKVQLVDGARDCRLMTRQMTNAVLSLSETHRFSKGIFAWVGFQTKWLTFENVERSAGTSKWSFWGLLCYSIEGIFAFSQLPLLLTYWFGFGFCLAAVILGVCTVFSASKGLLLILCILCLVGGVQLVCLSIFGQYLARIHGEVKRRPIYIAKEESQ